MTLFKMLLIFLFLEQSYPGKAKILAATTNYIEG